MTPPAEPDSPVETYLDELLLASRGHPRQTRHQLAEAEAHLRDATADGIARGLSPEDAESEAVSRFGPPRSLATAETHRQRRSWFAVIAGCVASGWWLGALAAIAVGSSGVLAAAVNAVWGQVFLIGRPLASALTPADCARWIANTHANSCTRAATGDWAHDTILFRGALGAAGVLALTAWMLWRHRVSRVTAGGLPEIVVDTVAVAAFGATGLWMTGQAIDTIIVASGRGAGQWLSAAPVALAFAAVFAIRLLRRVRAIDVDRGSTAESVARP